MAERKKVRRGRNGGVNKSERIRKLFTAQGADLPTRDVIAALRAKRIKVSAAHVSNVRTAMQQAGRSANGRNSKKKRGTSLSLESLMAAKRFADATGGVENAKQALRALAELSA